MSRKIGLLVVGLLALGALEFGLLGASAAGLVGGSGHGLPPIAQRGIVADTPTPDATATPEVPPFPAYSIEIFRPVPATVPCDGSQASTVRVFVRDYKGNPVPDGTNVTFLVYQGTPFSSYVPTSGGTASATFVIGSTQFTLEPNVLILTGDLSASIRVRCKPIVCSPSPPPNDSPPCPTATPTPAGPPTPYPCNPSPDSGPVSPPCATAEPPSPPQCDPTAGDSPPCATATPTPVDCSPSPASGPLSPPCATAVPPSPPQCSPSPADGNTSPPCATPTPLPNCAPYVPSSPPCAPSPPLATATPGVPCADADGDGRVTQRDVWFVASNVLKRHPDPRADVNHDGRVDWRDVAITVKQLGRRC